MSESLLKSTQSSNRETGPTNELEHVALRLADPLRFIRDLCGDLQWYGQQPIDVSMQEIAGVDAEPCIVRLNPQTASCC